MSILRTDKLSVSIAQKTVCNDLDLNIEAGETWGILGCNGVGKTTLLHTLAGLHEIDAGSIFVNENNIDSLTRKQIAQYTGVLLQHHEDAFPATVYETVLTGRHPHIDNWKWESSRDHDLSCQALEKVHMLGMHDRPIDKLSGGERQRVAIATLIAQTPKLFLLDEPNSHLDMKYQIEILDYLCQHNRENNCALIMSLHDINLAARYCTHILLLLGNGKFLQGPAKQLLTIDNLQATFGHPVRCITNNSETVFLPGNVNST